MTPPKLSDVLRLVAYSSPYERDTMIRRGLQWMNSLPEHLVDREWNKLYAAFIHMLKLIHYS